MAKQSNQNSPDNVRSSGYNYTPPVEVSSSEDDNIDLGHL